MASLSYFDRYLGPITLRECPVCRTKYRLVSFRRVAPDSNHPDKRTLRDVCNGCAAPSTPTLTEAQAQFKERQLPQRLSTAARKRHQRERSVAWARAVVHRLRREIVWAHGHAVRPSTPAQWQKFFEVYVHTLRQINTRVTQRYSRPGTPINPTPEESNPMTYINPHTLTTLKELYSKCPVIPGRKLYRDPWCLEWRAAE